MNEPLIMTEEYWANTHLSIARYYGKIKFNGREYWIVNKDGIDVFALSIMAEKQGKDKAIEPGEPCDLVLRELVPAYHKLGRDKILELVKEGKTEKEIKEIAKKQQRKEITNDNPHHKRNRSGRYLERTIYVHPRSERYFNC